MKLTGRQKEFLGNFLDMYREAKQPVHYSEVARKLGVSNPSAYEMLRILESYGLVESRYVLKREGKDRGRSTVVFSPTPLAEEVMAQLAGESWQKGEWEEVKGRILQSLREGKADEYNGLLDELSLRLEERKTPMLYLADMTTLAILSLHLLKEEKAHRILGFLRSLGFSDNTALQMLGGLTLGLSLVERANFRFKTRLLAFARKYHECLAQLSDADKKRLSDFAREVIEIVEPKRP